MPIFVGKEKMKLNTLRNEVLSIKRICFWNWYVLLLHLDVE
jgi:hypothetical protein